MDYSNLKLFPSFARTFVRFAVCRTRMAAQLAPILGADPRIELSWPVCEVIILVCIRIISSNLFPSGVYFFSVIVCLGIRTDGEACDLLQKMSH